MQEIKVSELVPHPKNDYFFDNMDGEKWTEFVESVKTSGVIEPIIITQDKTIVSGHQRIRACKELGIDTAWCEMRDYKTDDAVVKDLLETNIRQRGDVGGSMRKQGLRNKELEKLYGIKHGRPEKLLNNSEVNITQSNLAKQNNQSVDTWNNAKKLAEAIPELDEFIKTGVITTTAAIGIAKKLSVSEQEELLNSLPTAQRLTQKQIQEYIDKLQSKDNIIAGYELKIQKVKALEAEVALLKNDLDNRPVVEKVTETVVEKEVAPQDYNSTKQMLSGVKTEFSALESKYKAQVKELSELKKQIAEEKAKTPQEEFTKKLKDNVIFFCGRINDFIEKTGGMAWLANHINELPDYEKQSYFTAVNMIDAWVQSIKLASQETI